MIRWGMIGCGDVTEHKSARAYQQTEHFELLAVSARTPGKAQDYAKRHGVPRWYTDADAMINDPHVDAVYIATPPDSHLELALKVAKANKVCCIEKPMAVNFAQSQQIHDAFLARQLPLFIAYYRRSLPGFIAVKQSLEANEIGSIRHVQWHYNRPPSALDLSEKYNWRTDKTIAPGGYFDDLASHGIDIITFLAGNIAQAKGLCSNQQGLYSAYDGITATAGFESGATASMSWNFGSYEYQDSLIVHGSHGTAKLSVFSDKHATITNESGITTIAMPKPTPIQSHFVADLSNHLLNKVSHPSQGNSALHTSWVMDEILKC